jgi:HK97 family phage prohead protease
MEGYAAVYNTPTRIDSWEGTFDEQIKRGAFRKTIQERTPVLQFDHGAHPLIGSIPIGSIDDLREDSQGLKVTARLSDNWLIEPIRDAIANGTVAGMSFRFQVIREEWRDGKGNLITDPHELMDRLYNPDPDEPPLMRTLIEVRMAELGPVVFPAYKETSVGVRARSLATTIEGDEGMRRRIRQSLVTNVETAPVDDPAIRAEIARAVLFGDSVTTEEAEPKDVPADSHPSEPANDAPTNGHPSTKDRSDESHRDQLREQRKALFARYEAAKAREGSVK